MKKLFLVFLFEMAFFIFFSSFISATEINSPTYSGYFTSGISGGNMSSINYEGQSASFFQQPVGYINDSSYSGEYTFPSTDTESGEETPTEAPVTGDTTTTGGGGGTVTKNFEIIPESIYIKMKQGETQTEIITIKNTGTSVLNIEITEDKLTNFIKIDKPALSLAAGKTETITIDFLAREDTVPDLYIGKLIVKAGGIEKEIIVALDVESKESLFDVEVEIPSQYLKTPPGEDIMASIKIYNLGTNNTADALVEYTVKDNKGIVIAIASDTVAVETQMSYIKTINIPENTPIGRYTLYIVVNYEGKIASSSVFFEVAEEKSLGKEKLYIVLITFFILIIAIIIHYELELKNKRAGKEIKKVGIVDIAKKT
jgi:hypothetical protein